MTSQRIKLKANPIKSIKIEAAVSEFTDGGAAAGTFLSTTKKLPAGCIVLGAKVSAYRGFPGDTSATTIVGTAADDDKYLETGIDLFAVNSKGYGAPATFNTDQLETAEVAVQITVTTAADFTLAVTNGLGALVAEVFYLDLNAKDI